MARVLIPGDDIFINQKSIRQKDCDEAQQSDLHSSHGKSNNPNADYQHIPLVTIYFLPKGMTGHQKPG